MTDRRAAEDVIDRVQRTRRRVVEAEMVAGVPRCMDGDQRDTAGVHHVTVAHHVRVLVACRRIETVHACAGLRGEARREWAMVGMRVREHDRLDARSARHSRREDRCEVGIVIRPGSMQMSACSPPTRYVLVPGPVNTDGLGASTRVARVAPRLLEPIHAGDDLGVIVGHLDGTLRQRCEDRLDRSKSRANSWHIIRVGGMISGKVQRQHRFGTVPSALHGLGRMDANILLRADTHAEEPRVVAAAFPRRRDEVRDVDQVLGVMTRPCASSASREAPSAEIRARAALMRTSRSPSPRALRCAADQDARPPPAPRGCRRRGTRPGRIRPGVDGTAGKDKGAGGEAAPPGRRSMHTSTPPSTSRSSATVLAGTGAADTASVIAWSMGGEGTRASRIATLCARHEVTPRGRTRARGHRRRDHAGTLSRADLRVDTKADHTPVTDADRATEEALRDALRTAPPRAGRSSVRSWRRRACRLARWMLDPPSTAPSATRTASRCGRRSSRSCAASELCAASSRRPRCGRRWWGARGEGSFTELGAPARSRTAYARRRVRLGHRRPRLRHAAGRDGLSGGVDAALGLCARSATSGRTCSSPRASSTSRSRRGSTPGTSPRTQVILAEAGGRFSDFDGPTDELGERHLHQRPPPRRDGPADARAGPINPSGLVESPHGGPRRAAAHCRISAEHPAMLVIPTIDVQGGRSVRPAHGEYAQPTVYAADPATLARTFIDDGAVRLHVVDLDAARGLPSGGRRGHGRARRQRQRGVRMHRAGGRRGPQRRHRTALARERRIARDHRERCRARTCARGGDLRRGQRPGAPRLDVRAGASRVQGWTEDGLAATELLRRWRRWPAAGLVYTDTTRDGLMSGPNLDGLQICRDLYGGPVMVSGGIGSLEDIAACAAAGASGVLIGRALQEGSLDLGSALAGYGSPG